MDIRIAKAAGRLASLVRRAERGEEVVLILHGRAAVRLTPVAGAGRKSARAAPVDTSADDEDEAELAEE